jgi:hypothetical protein
MTTETNIKSLWQPTISVTSVLLFQLLVHYRMVNFMYDFKWRPLFAECVLITKTCNIIKSVRKSSAIGALGYLAKYGKT